MTSNANAWLLTFTYGHSSHQVKISLAANAITTILGTYWIAIVAIIVIATISAGVYFKKHKRETGHT